MRTRWTTCRVGPTSPTLRARCSEMECCCAAGADDSIGVRRRGAISQPDASVPDWNSPSTCMSAGADDAEGVRGRGRGGRPAGRGSRGSGATCQGGAEARRRAQVHGRGATGNHWPRKSDFEQPCRAEDAARKHAAALKPMDARCDWYLWPPFSDSEQLWRAIHAAAPKPMDARCGDCYNCRVLATSSPASAGVCSSPNFSACCDTQEAMCHHRLGCRAAACSSTSAWRTRRGRCLRASARSRQRRWQWSLPLRGRRLP